MANLELILYPSQILRKKSSVITDYSFEKYKNLVEDMKETLLSNKGIGLAAPQIGKNIRLIVVQTQERILTLVNPEIVKESFSQEKGEEGCLSIPGVFGTVRRSKKIKVKAVLENGEESVFDASGLFARVILHEIDHINGVLFIDRAKKITSGEALLKKYEQEKTL